MDTSHCALAGIYADTATLARCFLRWPLRRGIYVPNPQRPTDVALGDTAFVSIQMPFKPLPTFAAGCVVWICDSGVGVEFNPGFDDLVDLLEEIATLHAELPPMTF